MTIKLAAVAASIAAAGIITVGTASSASAHDHPCDNGEHHGDHHCQPPPPPVPTPSGFNLIFGGRNADRLPGTAGRDAIFGFGGNDRIFGRGGADRLYGMRGNDVIRSVDRSRDVVNGGPGRDRCIVNRNDIVKNCETIIVLL
jgi:Ca2+-binding RTX toxin-like protein